MPSHFVLCAGHSCAKQGVEAKTPNTDNQNVGTRSSQGFQKKPVFMERYKQIYFLGIPSYPNDITKGLRDKVTKFVGNNAISGEQNLRDFSDLLNDYEVEHEDVVIKFFIHSLTKDARD